MKQFLMAMFAVAMLAGTAQGALVEYDVNRVLAGNQFTFGSGCLGPPRTNPCIPDSVAQDPGGKFTYDTVANILYGNVTFRVQSNQASYIYAADWVADFNVNRLITLNTQCIFISGADGCGDFANGVQPGPISVISGSLNPTGFESLASIRWSSLGPPFASAFFIVELSEVPVPAAVWLFASALGLMGFIRRRAAAA